MSSRAWRTRTFKRSCASVSWSAIRRSIRACMSIGLPRWIASSTSRRSSRATWGSSPLAAFARTICNEFSMTVRKCASRTLSAVCRAAATKRRAAPTSWPSMAAPNWTSVCSNPAMSAPRFFRSSRCIWRLANASRTVLMRVASRTESWASLARPLTLPKSFVAIATSAWSKMTSARLTSDLPEGRLCGRDPPGLAQAVPRLLGEEGDVSEDAAADRVAGLGEELAGLPDVDPFVPSEVHLGRGAVEEPFQPGPSRLRVCGLHRLGGERPDLSVLPDREGLAGLLEEGLGIADGPSPFLRVPDAGLGLFQTRVEGVLSAFVEAPERHPLQEP